MAYLGNAPGVESQRLTTAFTATDGQTAFNPVGGYTLGYVDAYLNGVKLIDGTDYTADDGVTVTLSTGAALNDNVELVTYTPRGLSDGYTKVEADGRYVQPNDDVTFGTFTSTGIDDNATSKMLSLTPNTLYVVDKENEEALSITSSGIAGVRSHQVNIGQICLGEYTVSSLQVYGKILVRDGGGKSFTIDKDSNSNAVIDYNSGFLGSSDLYIESNGSSVASFSADGNVGIGTASPDNKLTIADSATITVGKQWGLDFQDSSKNEPQAFIYAEGQYTANFNTDLLFGTIGTSGSATERMRLDSSGNLLVGQTTPSNNAAGMYVRPSSSSGFIADGTGALTLGRLNSDGVIANFLKDGLPVGSIGVDGGRLTLASNNGSSGGGIKIDSAQLMPTNKDGTATDAHLSLGASSVRWNNLYLSGGVYLGGTGSANKLDDYEEGTFTPTANFHLGNGTLSYSTQLGHYIKIGKMVSVHIHMTINKGTASGNFRIDGLPFTVANSQATRGGVSLGYYTGINNVNYNPMMMGDNAQTLISIRKPDSADVAATDLDNTVSVWLQYTYYV